MGIRLPLVISALLLSVTALLLSNGGGSFSSQRVQAQSTPNSPQVSTDVLTWHNDIARTGQNLTETALTHANVNSSSFGQLFSVAVDGKVDAQPLYVSQVALGSQGIHSVIYAATEHDSVYAIDARTGAVLWQVSLLGAGESPSDIRGCGQVTPEIGITATPVIDLNAGAHGTIYLIAMSRNGNGNNYHQRLHALDITTGLEEFNGPMEVAATFPGGGDGSRKGTVVFDPKQYKSRPGLMLLNGVVYTGWGSHCDNRPYTGWLIGFNQLTLNRVSVFNFAPNGSEAAIWNAGGGLTADPASGRIFVSVANGTFDATLDGNGLPNQGDYGNAFVRLNANGGQLVPEDYWTMHDTAHESAFDVDLGSGGLMLLPELKNARGTVVQLGTGAGKDGRLYVFNRANLGKFDSQSDTTLYQEIDGVLGSVFSSPAWFNGTVYYGSVGKPIEAFTMNGALLEARPASSSSESFAYPGATPSISANGTADAILWAVENSYPAVLHAYDATDLSTELYNSNQAAGGRDQLGPGNKYIVPTIADGRVIVGTTNSVAVFGLLHASLSPQTITFDPVAPDQIVGMPLTLNGSASSGLPVVFTASPSDACSVSGIMVSFVTAGSCTITASQPGDSTYAAADPVSQTVSVLNAQTIAFGPVGRQTVGTPFTLTASASSGLPVTFTFAPVNVCTISGNTVSLSYIGTCTITAWQAGNGIYQTAPPVSQSFRVTGADALQFVPITPCRVADTQNSSGLHNFAVMQSNCGIPGSAVAYSLNVTAVPARDLYYLIIGPTGQPRPYVSTLNSWDGRAKANAAIVSAGVDGAVSVFVSNSAHVVLNVNGYFVPAATPSALAFYPVAPCRVVDTRRREGPFGGPSMSSGDTRSFAMPSSACNLPATAGAYSLNFTVVPHDRSSFLTTWPTGQSQPSVSTLNAFKGEATATATIVAAGDNGAVSVSVTGDADVVIDVNGYFGPPASGGLSFFKLQPCRILDTRIQGEKQPFVHKRLLDIAGSCSVPSNATTIVANAIVVPQPTLGFLSLWADGEPQPDVPTLNGFGGIPTSNMAIIPMSNGRIDAYASDPTHLIFDVSGYFAP